jgi:hypothetical protein
MSGSSPQPKRAKDFRVAVEGNFILTLSVKAKTRLEAATIASTRLGLPGVKILTAQSEPHDSEPTVLYAQEYIRAVK